MENASPTMSSQSFMTKGDVMVRLPKHKKLGALFFFLAGFCWPVALLSWTVMQFIFAATVTYSADGHVIAPVSATAQLASFILGLIAMSSLLWLVLGIIFSIKRTLVQGYEYDSRSGKGKDSVVPDEAKGWNWGAAFLTPLWGPYSNVWLWLLAFVVPFWWVIMGIFGSEWAWRKDYWPSIDAFKASQKKWTPWSIAVLVLTCLMVFASMIVPVFLAGFVSSRIESDSKLRNEIVSSTQGYFDTVSSTDGS